MPKLVVLIVLGILFAAILLTVNWRRRRTPVVGKPTRQCETISVSGVQRDQFMMTIADVIPIMNRGVCVVGEVGAGAVNTGDIVRVLSVTGHAIAASKVSGVYANFKPAEHAKVGDSCGLHLTGISADQLERGGKIVAHTVS